MDETQEIPLLEPAFFLGWTTKKTQNCSTEIQHLSTKCKMFHFWSRPFFRGTTKKPISSVRVKAGGGASRLKSPMIEAFGKAVLEAACESALKNISKEPCQIARFQGVFDLKVTHLSSFLLASLKIFWLCFCFFILAVDFPYSASQRSIAQMYLEPQSISFWRGCPSGIKVWGCFLSSAKFLVWKRTGDGGCRHYGPFLGRSTEGCRPSKKNTQKSLGNQAGFSLKSSHFFGTFSKMVKFHLIFPHFTCKCRLFCRGRFFSQKYIDSRKTAACRA